MSNPQEASKEKDVIYVESRSSRAFWTIFLIVLVLGGIGGYFIYQRSFIKELENEISNTAEPPEKVIHKAYFKYCKFYAKQPNITGVSFRDIYRRHFQVNLPPAKVMKASIIEKLRDQLIPERYPLSVNEYRVLKMEEAQKMFRLAKIGDTVTVQSPRLGKYTGVFNGYGSKKSSIRIDRKVFSLYDLERETKAMFDPALNDFVKEEYVFRECGKYKSEIMRFSKKYLNKEMINQGYFFRDKFYSPSEYLAALKTNKFPEEDDQDKKTTVVAQAAAKEPEMKKLSSSKNIYLTQPTYYSHGVKQRSVATMISSQVESSSKNDKDKQPLKKEENPIKKEIKNPFLEKLLNL